MALGKGSWPFTSGYQEIWFCEGVAYTGQGQSQGGASGVRKRMARITEAVAAYALAAALLITGAAALAGTVIRKTAPVGAT